MVTNRLIDFEILDTDFFTQTFGGIWERKTVDHAKFSNMGYINHSFRHYCNVGPNADLIYQVVRCFDSTERALKFHRENFSSQIEVHTDSNDPTYIEIDNDLLSNVGVECKFAKFNDTSFLARQFADLDMIFCQLIAVFVKDNIVHKVFVSTNTDYGRCRELLNKTICGIEKL